MRMNRLTTNVAAMFSLIALSITASHSQIVPQSERITPADVARLVESIGYPFDEIGNRTGSGTITRRGAKVLVGTATSTKPEDAGPQRRVVGLQLQIEIPVGVDVPLSKANRPFSSFAVSDSLHLIPHLGRTVTLIQDIDLEAGFEENRIRAAFDKFWRDGAAYAQEHGGKYVQAPARDWSKARFPDSYVLDRADQISFQRAAAAWGFKRQSQFGYPFHFDAAYYDLNGVMLSVFVGPLGNEPHNGGYIFSSTVKLSDSIDAKMWSEAQKERVKWAEFWPQHRNMVEVSTKVDMAKGVNLGDLRRRAVTFATNVKTLKSSIEQARSPALSTLDLSKALTSCSPQARSWLLRGFNHY
jgi:hypothetical protein